MFEKIREIVGGPKRRLKEEGYNLDLTYITPRIIAMAFPASGFEKVYRNSIDDVAEFLQKKHGSNYIVVNLSGRPYNFKKFTGKFNEFEWEDHQAPSFNLLF
jgi:phosphatidylinositol-3,4,5-trisphosphate 3-phosphatase and dual-specificity protein phosphatase PTEN